MKKRFENQKRKLKINLKKPNYLCLGFIFAFLSLILFSSAVSAEAGCCFNTYDGSCSKFVEENNCNMGLFYSNAECAIDECQEGCCVLGTGTEFTTARRCGVLSKSFGVEENWNLQINAQECSNLAKVQELGACLSGDYAPFDCKMKTKAQCGNEDKFKAGILCTAAYLNTTCKIKEKTTLVDGKDEIYFTDSCGNVANIYDSTKIKDADYWTYIKTKEQSCGAGKSNAGSAACGNCDYELGSRAILSDTQKTKPVYGTYICKDLNCVDSMNAPRKNGEKWCVFNGRYYSSSVSGGNSNIPDEIKYSYKIGDYTLEFIKKSTADYYDGGTVSKSDGTPVCEFKANDDIRHAVNQGLASKGPAQCKEGHGEPINYIAGNGKPVTIYADGYLEEPDKQVSGTYRAIFTGNTVFKTSTCKLPDPGEGAITSLSTEVLSYQGSTPVGSIFSTMYCYDGEIKQEPCADRRAEYCEFGTCVANNGGSCYGIEKEDECKTVKDCNWVSPIGAGSTEAVKCDGSIPPPPDPDAITSKDLMNDLELGNCVPKISLGGYSKSVGASSQTSGYCKNGDAVVEVLFDHDINNGDCMVWRVKSSSEGTTDTVVDILNKKYGNAGLVFSDPAKWIFSGNRIDCQGRGIGMVKFSDYSATPTNEISEILNNQVADSGFREGNIADHQSKLKALISFGVIPDKAVIKYLESTCKSLGDCDGKANWLGTSGAGSVSGNVVAGITGNAVETKDECEKRCTQTEYYHCMNLSTNKDDCEYPKTVCLNKCSTIGTAGTSGSTGSANTKGTADECNKKCQDEYLTRGANEQELALNDATRTICLQACASYNEIANAIKTGSKSSGTDYSDMFSCKSVDGSGDRILCTLDFTCKEWRAPIKSADCGKCGADKYACTPYKCESLGQNCLYSDAQGVDKGFCYSSDDYQAPKVLSYELNPKSPVPPYSSVEITVKTDEFAHCKFEMGGEKTYDEMTKDFGDGYNTVHKVRLNVPGKIAAGDINEYKIISKDGRYDMRVKCQDIAGNPMIASYPIRFEVMQTPKTIPTIILNFTPASGSSIKYGTTEKEIEFQIDFPSECRWDFADKEFSAMKNNFSCDTSLSDYGTKNGYKCSGILTDVTLNYGNQTKYYIRCKDQPWIQNDSQIINGVEYKRNTNDKSKIYSLRPSKELKIQEVSPTGTKKVSGDNLTIELKAITADGAFNGVAVCKWELSSMLITGDLSLIKFSKTNSNTHRQTITNPETGTNYGKVVCQDSAGNIAEKDVNFDLEIDFSKPIINRMLNQIGFLKVKTDENSVCYVSFDKDLKCGFKIENSTLMTGVEKEHTTEWKDDKTYFVKCRDFFGNEDTSCGKIIKTY